MKKIFLLIMVILVFITGCNRENPINEKTEKIDIIKNHIISYGQTNGDEFKDLSDYRIGEYDISLPFDWSCREIYDTNIIFHLHGFLFLDYTYFLYEETEDPKYKNFIIAYILDWVDDNKVPLSGNEWAWNDDAVARRVLRFSYYLSQWRNDFSNEEYNKVLASLAAQAELLASDEFYTKNHNHGMFQDMGLIAYALLIADEEDKDIYLNLAKNRSKEYFEYAFTSDGVHKEHSPSYHINVSQKLLFFRDIYKNIDDDFSEYLKKLYDNTSEYIVQISMPDGTLPSIGDSGRATLKDGLYDTPGYKYIVTKGEEGTEPDENWVSTEGGYAVMRSSWEDTADEATYILFMASTHSSTHKHGDDLSFILYHKGDLFTEAGSRNYLYKEEMTNYSYSGYGHNVLLVDGGMFPVQYGLLGSHNIYEDALKTKITDYDFSPSGGGEVEGKQFRFENIEQTRSIVYDKSKNKIIVQDNIVNNRERVVNADLIYHIAEGIEIRKIETNHYAFFRDGMEVAEVQVVSDSDNTNVEIFSGDKQNPPYNTWIFEGNETPKIGSLMKVNFDVEKNVNVKLEITLK